MADSTLIPFYERLTYGFPGIFAKVLISILLGLAFLVPHYLIVENKVFDDWSWFLSVLITIAMLNLYYATHKFRAILPEMDTRLPSDGDKVYMTPLKSVLSDRNFILAGSFFGLLNCVFGLYFGLPYNESLERTTILWGYFLAGFVCGMAVFGIYGISLSISAFARKAKASFDFTSPDRCGRTLFLGEALVVFSSVTLVVGVMITVYIWMTDWAAEITWEINSIKYFWVAFPYVMSLVALFAPAIPINKALREYKSEQEADVLSRLTKIRNRLADDRIQAKERKELREDYEFQTGIREKVYNMRTWPFGLRANGKYLTVFMSNLLVTVKSSSNWLDNVFPDLQAYFNQEWF